jgi:prepilin-type processing-associated H-X9-DG protein
MTRKAKNRFGTPKRKRYATKPYADDNDGRYPIVETWFSRRLPIKSVLSCPSFKLKSERTEPWPSYLETGYLYNGFLTWGTELETMPIDVWLKDPRNGQGRKASDIAYPATTIVLCDGVINSNAIIEPEHIMLAQQDPSNLSVQMQRHQGGGNYLFSDGHVKWFAISQISPEEHATGTKPSLAVTTK